ncbi:LacI family DNA-binding transcriptional regulator [Ureibacillus chungkukjangi]|uniref:DNA-binding LacI/PurR family transcriptional regulator n=1 Tax=Ureibacillus chungkukjangi TaxID=1202712 RepID=A0A318TTE9_9BACL|nr:LacI family DNA-binding transcriptional regulator [Ureibacillus chungkukjangi]PYF07934.1 DNA-binding LacI/PurR family transcriptional regulator [Ureibacillus chungkukjangi]HCG4536047.1 LacI family DNA-binding transcriptional regulator [Salmonella enterica subsp. enterica serovar Typhi str. AG3]
MSNGINARDVAKLAGVSQSSVSRVFFGGASVSEKTRKKVLAAAEELGYVPNEFARSLITNKTRLIGLVMKGVHNPFYPQVLQEFTTHFNELGYTILFVHTNHDEIQKEDIEMLLHYHVAGVIITDATLSLKVIEEFKNNKIPVVLFNRKVEEPNFFSVGTNNLEASRQIAKFLIEKGCKDMAYISGARNTSTSIEREKGFSEMLAENKVPYKIYHSDYSYDGGFKTAKEIIQAGDIPSAFFVANDIMALGVLDALREQSIDVPAKTKVIGFDNIEMAAWPIYNLTTWEQPIAQMAKETVSYIISEIEEYTDRIGNIEINGELIERKTT